jgi:RNA polymerase sigma-70 factor (ECF subfamily)
VEEQYLINGLKTRNQIVFDFIFHYYYSGLCAFCEKMVNNQAAAEDIVQNLFVTLWLKNQQLEINTSLKSYLFTAVRNRSLDYLKQVKRKNKKLASMSAMDTLPENLSTLWFAESELREIINKSLEKLPPRCREIFILSRFEGMKNQEIASRLGLSQRTVELQIYHALKKMRIELKNYLPLSIFFFLLHEIH